MAVGQDWRDLPKAEFAFPGPLRDRLVELILAGTKTSTTGLLADVDLQHVLAEGEGDATVAGWRAGHERFWASAEMLEFLGDPDFHVEDDTQVVLETFRCVEQGREREDGSP